MYRRSFAGNLATKRVRPAGVLVTLSAGPVPEASPGHMSDQAHMRGRVPRLACYTHGRSGKSGDYRGNAQLSRPNARELMRFFVQIAARRSRNQSCGLGIWRIEQFLPIASGSQSGKDERRGRNPQELIAAQSDLVRDKEWPRHRSGRRVD